VGPLPDDRSCPDSRTRVGHTVQAYGAKLGRKRYGKDRLIAELRGLAAQLGHTPTRAEADAAPGFPCYKTYVRHFGGWNAALEAAGLALNRRVTRHDRETMLEALRGLAAQLGRAPMHRELPEWGLPWAPTYARYFGSWRAALAAIGLQPHVPGKRYERDGLLGTLSELTEELGRPPTQAELRRRDGLPHPSTYKYRFGGWNRALEAAGPTPPHSKRGKDT
jgi:hypothetical protein